MPSSSGARGAAALQLVCIVAGLLLVPLALRAANRARQVPDLEPTYLPAIEGPRDRRPFDSAPREGLAHIKPTYVIIGDSMAGSRIEPPLLGKLTAQAVVPLWQAGTGSAWWYLALKNWVIASGAHPKCTFIFFRDTNLTDATFRVEEPYRWSLDLVAGDREDEVNAILGKRGGGSFYRLRTAVNRAYHVSEAREWIEPGVGNLPAQLMFAYRRPREVFMTQLNDRMGLDHLRTMDAADIRAAEDEDADFDRFINESFLPLMLRDAQRADVPLCFVRVQRRPEGGQPPFQSSALRKYTRQLRDYIEANGAYFHDDYGDPQQTLDLYGDGDHLTHDGRFKYTELFYNRLRLMFP
ncbi:MAG TPA: hypothetical protein VH458_04865 [Vicinamibacterales bacterium]|jgi:hypothetical protein